jgi:hypothetical protein
LAANLKLALVAPEGFAGVDAAEIRTEMGEGSRSIVVIVPVTVGPPVWKGNGGYTLEDSDASNGEETIAYLPVESRSRPEAECRCVRLSYTPAARRGALGSDMSITVRVEATVEAT